MITAIELSRTDKATLVDVATTTIRTELAHGRSAVPSAQEHTPPLRRHAATFVTLQRDDRLLGCIGALEPRRPLVVDVAANAVGAAFADPRVPPLTRSDYRVMSVKISVLGPTVPFARGRPGRTARQPPPRQ